jgi:fatty acid synthase subunit alpha
MKSWGVEPALFEGYDPNKKQLLQEIVLNYDMEPFMTSKEEAQRFTLEHGARADVFEVKETGEWSVQLKKGATLHVPKALRFDRFVAGQLPTACCPIRV